VNSGDMQPFGRQVLYDLLESPKSHYFEILKAGADIFMQPAL